MNFLRRYYSQLIFLIIGILAGFFISRLPITFEEKTNWVALANFFLTIGLAFYLEFVVRPSLSNNRNEKDILIDQLKELKGKVIEAHDSYLTKRNINPLTQNDKSDMIVKLRSISNLIDLLKQTDEYCKATKKTEISDKVFKNYLAYKKSLTGQNFNKPDFFYDRYYWNKHDSTYKGFMKGIMYAIIDINKV
jgi:hypothetical protein